MITRTQIPLNRKKHVCTSNVLFLQAVVNYTIIYLNDGKSVVVSKTLKQLEHQLVNDENFFRTHKSYIVNLEYVTGFRINEEMTINVNEEHQVSLSRRRKDNFLKLARQNNLAA
jgi:DNA-binding LytR/AlgR family response regulator